MVGKLGEGKKIQAIVFVPTGNQLISDYNPTPVDTLETAYSSPELAHDTTATADDGGRCFMQERNPMAARTRNAFLCSSNTFTQACTRSYIYFV